MAPAAKRWQESASETAQVVLPNDSNPLGYILGGTVMHMIDITGAIACHRHTNSLALTAGVDSLDFLHPIKVGDIIILNDGDGDLPHVAGGGGGGVLRKRDQWRNAALPARLLTFVALDDHGVATAVPPLLLETPEDEARSRQAQTRERKDSNEARRSGG